MNALSYVFSKGNAFLFHSNVLVYPLVVVTRSVMVSTPSAKSKSSDRFISLIWMFYEKIACGSMSGEMNLIHALWFVSNDPVLVLHSCGIVFFDYLFSWTVEASPTDFVEPLSVNVKTERDISLFLINFSLRRPMHLLFLLLFALSLFFDGSKRQLF